MDARPVVKGATVLSPLGVLSEKADGPTSSGIWLFILLMVVMVLGTAITGRKGRKK